ncbi:lipase [Paenalcaligenes hominis]|uniref:Lipase n=1 Tax=Paenalcaligenes hominis TaxID=643674 RepID=A0A1U9JYQ0_9BURK|nr:ABC transporter ATP-binding protein [Paenalcaligenes hominis]AQS50923.1 lipase [Paenalcaligenes hominis]
MSELIVNNIHLAYGDNPVLKGVSLSIAKGEVVSLLGASGSGKTTLLRAVAGLEQPHTGSIHISNNTVYDSAQKLEVAAEQRNLGLVFQSYALWPHKTVFDNVAYPLQLRKESKSHIKEKVDAVLDQLGLGGLQSRYPNQLSGGQQQRVAIARALVYNPPVMLLDEPLSNLDAKLREEARSFLRELILELNISALLVTHDQHEAMAISDRILLLNQGTIEQQGTPEAIYSRPETLYTAEFMGSNNRLPAKVIRTEGHQAELDFYGHRLWGSTQHDLAPDSMAQAICRVEQAIVHEHAVPNSLALNLSTSMYLGDKWEYVFRHTYEDTHTQLRAFGSKPLGPGRYFVEFPTKQLWVYAG